jgi:putative FmdB family regulatory protein
VPTYEYRCPEGHEFEHFARRIAEAADTMRCPTCGASASRRISAGGGLLFKGSGFYITDYGKDGKKDLRAKAGGGDAKAAPDNGKSSDQGKGADGAGKAGDAKAAAGASKPTPSASTSGGSSAA